MIKYLQDCDAGVLQVDRTILRNIGQMVSTLKDVKVKVKGDGNEEVDRVLMVLIESVGVLYDMVKKSNLMLHWIE